MKLWLAACPALLACLSPGLTARPVHHSLVATSPIAKVRMANLQALIEPSGDSAVNAIQVYPFVEGNLYRLYASPGQVTDIALQAGETIVSVAAGDTVRWTVGDTSSGSGEGKRSHILIKPFAAGLKTNLLIATSRRTYHLSLESNAETAMAAVSWSYPADELLAIRRRQVEAEASAPVASGIAVENLNFNYVVSGDAPDWRPLRVFDDGRQTYVEFPASIAVGEAPPLFGIGPGGKAELLNYRMSGHYYVVDRLFAAAELRLGEKRQAVVRIVRMGGTGTRTKGRTS
jgi:type IV secretion system protein VirB9